MADKFIDIQVSHEDEEKILHALRRVEDNAHAQSREFVNDMARCAQRWLVTTVPVHDGYLLKHIQREPPTWLPGGAGGGGEWEAIVGIKGGRSFHPWYVEFGTGIYAGRGMIYPRISKALRLEKRPPEIDSKGRITRYKFRRWVRGQEGQHYFYETWRALNIYAVPRLPSRIMSRD